MGEYGEAFVAFDVAKRKHAVAMAEGGRRGEVRFLGEIENSPATVDLARRGARSEHGRVRVRRDLHRLPEGARRRHGVTDAVAAEG